MSSEIYLLTFVNKGSSLKRQVYSDILLFVLMIFISFCLLWTEKVTVKMSVPEQVIFFWYEIMSEGLESLSHILKANGIVLGSSFSMSKKNNCKFHYYYQAQLSPSWSKPNFAFHWHPNPKLWSLLGDRRNVFSGTGLKS